MSETLDEAIGRRFPIGVGATWDDLDGDPYVLLAALRQREPVTWLAPLGGWAVTTHAGAEALLRDESRFGAHREGSKPHEIFGATMLSSDAAEHRAHREPFEAPFRLRPVRDRYTGLVEETVDRLVTDLRPAGGAELGAALASQLPVEVIRAVLGLSLDPAQVRATYDDFAAALGDYRGDAEVDRRALVTRRAFDASLRADFVRMRATEDGSVVGDVLRAGPSVLAEDDVVANALVVLFGGIETVETLTLNAVYALLAHPDQLALVRDDPALVPAAVDEVLRWAPPLGFLGRRALAAGDLDGVAVGKGEFACAVVLAANRDPAVFEEPDAFDVRRANSRRALSFGHGPHFCLGFNLARLEAVTALRALLRLPDLRFDPDRPRPALRGFAFRRPPSVHVRWSTP